MDLFSHWDVLRNVPSEDTYIRIPETCAWMFLLRKKYPCGCEEVKDLDMEVYPGGSQDTQKCPYKIETEGDFSGRGEDVRKTKPPALE